MTNFDDRGLTRIPASFGDLVAQRNKQFPYRSDLNVTPQREKDLSGVRLEENGRFNGGLTELVETLLERNPGVFIGDAHGNFAIAETLIQSMERFRNAGVAVLCFEMVRSTDQLLLDRAEESGNYDEVVAYLVKGWEKTPGMAKKYAEIVEAAHKADIRVVGIDRGHTGDSRLESSNPHWVSVITEEAKKFQDKKYVVFGGGGHAANYPMNKGVDFELGIPSVVLEFKAAEADYVERGDGKKSDFIFGLKRSQNQPVDIFDGFG